MAISIFDKKQIWLILCCVRLIVNENVMNEKERKVSEKWNYSIKIKEIWKGKKDLN